MDFDLVMDQMGILSSLSIGMEATVWCRKRNIFYGAFWIVTQLNSISENFNMGKNSVKKNPIIDKSKEELNNTVSKAYIIKI